MRTVLRKAILKAEEDYADDGIAEEAHQEAVEAASGMGAPLTDEQKGMLDHLTHWAESAKNRKDAKAEAILSWLEIYLKTDGEWNGERVILFTEYRATHAWLHGILASEGWGGEHLMTLTGGTDPDEREQIKAAKVARDLAQKEAHKLAAQRAAEIMKKSDPAPKSHRYLGVKKIEPHGSRVSRGNLVVPVMDGDQITSHQFISPDGDKRFLRIGGWKASSKGPHESGSAWRADRIPVQSSEPTASSAPRPRCCRDEPGGSAPLGVSSPPSAVCVRH